MTSPNKGKNKQRQLKTPIAPPKGRHLVKTMLFTEQTCLKHAQQGKNTPNPPLDLPPVAAWISRSLFTLTPTSFSACSSADLQKPKNTLGSVNSDPQHYKSPKLCYRRLVLSPAHPGSVTTRWWVPRKKGLTRWAFVEVPRQALSAPWLSPQPRPRAICCTNNPGWQTQLQSNPSELPSRPGAPRRAHVGRLKAKEAARAFRGTPRTVLRASPAPKGTPQQPPGSILRKPFLPFIFGAPGAGWRLLLPSPPPQRPSEAAAMSGR